ncbi:hypothetical protein Tco_0863636 [Tanacetum coccineum]
MTCDTPPQISKLTSDHSGPIQVEDLTHLKENQHFLEIEGHQSGGNLTRRQTGEVHATNGYVGLHATLFHEGTTRPSDEQQVLKSPPSRPTQDNRGQGSSGGSRVQSRVDDFVTPIPNRFDTRVQKGDGSQYIQVTSNITAFLKQMVEEQRLASSQVNITMSLAQRDTLVSLLSASPQNNASHAPSLTQAQDLNVEDNDNHLLNYVLDHQRPELSKSIDANLVFDIAGHTLLFERSEFCLVTSFAYGKLVFPEYMDDGIPPFLRRKTAKGKDAKRKVSQGKAAQPSDKGDIHSVTILDLRSLIWDDEKWKKLSVEDSVRVCLLYMSEQIFMGKEDKKVVKNSLLRLVWILESFPNSHHWWSKESEVIPRCLAWTRREGFEKRNYPQLFRPDSNPITQIRPTLKERYENWCRKSYDYVACKEKSEQVDDQNGFTRDDEPEAEQDGSGTSDRASAGAKVEETKSTREIALEEELDLPRVFVDEADVAADDNAKATSVRNDVGVPNAAADGNAKATSVCDDIDQADATADDNAKVPIFHVYNTPVDNENVLMKDAHDIINHTDPSIQAV